MELKTAEEILAYKLLYEPDNPTDKRILKEARALAARVSAAAEAAKNPPKPLLDPNAFDMDGANASLQEAHDMLVMAQHEKSLRKQNI